MGSRRRQRTQQRSIPGREGSGLIPLELPDQLRGQQARVESAIRQAFQNVSREGGFSWSQAEVIDGNGDDVAMRAALSKDTERSWEELVDDPAWDDIGGVGGFCFLDPIGFRYYLAPAMIRHVLGRSGSTLEFTLTIWDKHQRRQVSQLTPDQNKAVAKFIRFMVARESWIVDRMRAKYGSFDDNFLTNGWQTAYDSHWKRFDQAG